MITGCLLLAACGLSDLDEPTVDFDKTGVDTSSQITMANVHVVPGVENAHVLFAPGKDELDADAATPVMPFLDKGVQSVRIVSPAKDPQNAERSLALKRFLRGHGIESSSIGNATDSALEPGNYRLEFITAEAVPPDCPNWSASASTNSKNLPWSQLGCSYVSNISAMAADPHDLEQGSGNVRPDAQRVSIWVQQYRANKDWSPAANGGGGASASGTTFGGGGGGSSSSVPSTGSQ